MSRKRLKQYLELLNNSGIESFLHLAVPVNKEQPVVKSGRDKVEETSGVHQTNNKSHYPESKEDSGIKLSDKMTTRQPSREIDKGRLLQEKRQEYKDCRKCVLHKNRINFVYGEGNPNAKLMLIGEGPGEEENKQGKPFVGRAGQLLTKMLAAINLSRDDVYIANIVKCQPPGNKNPGPDEIASCLPYLIEQIRIIKPRLIVLMGRVAALGLLGLTSPLREMRLNRYNYTLPDGGEEDGEVLEIETYVTYHPAALLRNPAYKKYSWIDLQKYRDILKLS